MTPHFHWKSAYKGEVDYIITDETGTYRASLRYSAGCFHPHEYNCDTIEEWIRDIADSVGVLHKFCSTTDGPVPPATLAAFNKWRQDEHDAQIAHLLAHPEKYGNIYEDTSPWWVRALAPPVPAVTGVYVVGKGWEIVP